MMRKIFSAITMAGILCVSASYPSMADNLPEPADIQLQTAEEAGQTETEAAVAFQADLKIVTPYYSIAVPAEWMGSCRIKTVDNTTGKWVELFRIGEYSAGHLFSILITDTEDYKVIADHELIGELTSPAGNNYHVVAVYPTDVQYSKEEKDSYFEMFDQTDAILNTIQAEEGCTYVSCQ